jgi:hypothetical protein
MGHSERLATAILLADTDQQRRPIGTGVFLRVAGLTDHVAATYLVTARHVPENSDGRVYVRLTRTSGEIEDVPLDRWFFNNDSHEVAVARCAFSERDYVFSTLYPPRPGQNLSLEEHRERSRHLEGREVFFIGTYPKIATMADQNRTMIRAGLIGLTWQDRVRVRNRNTGVELLHTVHLIDCYAHSGFSGAPCFCVNVSEADPASFARIRKSAAGDVTIGDPLITAQDVRRALHSKRETWELVGILLGHFPHTEKAFDLTDRGTGAAFGVEVNAGIGLVVPVTYVAATLMQDDVLRDRDVAPPLAAGDGTLGSIRADVGHP